MIDFTDYNTYLNGFLMLTFLYFGYDGAHDLQSHYKSEYRFTKNKAIWSCVIHTIFAGLVYYIAYEANSELKQQGYKTISVTELNVWFTFWYSYIIATIVGAHRGANKLNEEELQ